jgi:hypothetical protein
VLFIYITRLASNEIFSPSNKIHLEVDPAKDLSALDIYIYVYVYISHIKHLENSKIFSLLRICFKPLNYYNPFHPNSAIYIISHKQVT